LNRKFYALILVAIALSVAALLPFHVPYSVKAYGKVVPIQKWVLTMGTDGQLIVKTFDYERGMSDECTVSQFDRGETMSFSVHPSVSVNGFVNAGDTLGLIHSSSTEQEITELRGELATAQATLAAESSGDKLSVIEEANLRLDHARIAVAEQQRVLNRLKHLVSQNLVSLEEYEAAESAAQLLKVEVSIAESQLTAARTGEKPEQINLIRQQIEALENEIGIVEKRMAAFTITSPIDGKIGRASFMDTLLVLYDTSSFVAFVPIKFSECEYVAEHQSVEISVDGSPSDLTGQLTSVDKEVHLLNGEQTVLAAAIIGESSENIFPGMVAKCKIICEPVTMVGYAGRLLKSLLN